MSTARRTDSPRRESQNLIESFGRQPPKSLESELGVLGSIMLLPEVCDDVAMILKPDDFYDDANKSVYQAMIEMQESGKRLDPTLLLEYLKSKNELEKVGGLPYLGKIVDSVPHAAHAKYYAEIVREKSTLRSIISASTEILASAYDESNVAAQLLSNAEQKIFAILESRSSVGRVQNISDILHEALDRIDARVRGEHTQGGVSTGFTDLDGMTTGLHNGELVILAARPSMGKTAFAMNIAEHVAIVDKVPVLFISLEMSSIELADRLLCSVARVDSHRLRNGTVSREDRHRIIQCASEISQAPFYVDDSPGRTVTEIAAAARRIARREGRLGMIVIDYLQLIEPDNPKDPRQEQVAKIARRLKGLAREVKVPVVCLAQLNRQADANDKEPKLSHLRESGAIEQDADVVMFIHRDEYYDRQDEALRGKARIILAKQRNGPTGDVNLLFRRECTRFENLAPERYSEFDSYNAEGGGF